MSLKSSDRVLVIGGPFTGCVGEVLKVEGDQQLVMVAITIFGKSIAIALQPSQLEPDYDGGNSHAHLSDSPSDPDAPVRDPRRSGPGDRNSAASVVEPEADQLADAMRRNRP